MFVETGQFERHWFDDDRRASAITKRNLAQGRKSG